MVSIILNFCVQCGAVRLWKLKKKCHWLGAARSIGAIQYWSLTFFLLTTIRFKNCFILLDWYPRDCFIICWTISRWMFIIFFSPKRTECFQYSLWLLINYSFLTSTCSFPIMAKLMKPFHRIQYSLLFWSFLRRNELSLPHTLRCNVGKEFFCEVIITKLRQLNLTDWILTESVRSDIYFSYEKIKKTLAMEFSSVFYFSFNFILFFFTIQWSPIKPYL